MVVFFFFMVKSSRVSRKGGGFVRNAIRFGTGLYNAYRFQNRMRNSRTRTQNRSGTQSGQGVTTHYDRRQVYRYRKMPRFKKRRFKRYARTFRANLLSNTGNRTRVINQLVSDTTDPGLQGSLVAHLYGLKGTNTTYETGCNDLYGIEVGDTGISDNAKLFFESAVLDCTITNTSTDSSNNSYVGPLEVDVYEIYHYATSKDANIVSQLQDGYSFTPAIPGSTKITSIGERGVSLFEGFPGLIKTKARIQRKTKYFLPAGQCITYQIRDPKNRMITGVEMNNDAYGYAYPKFTKSVYVIFKTVAGFSTGSVNVRCAMGVTRRYTYKFLENKENATAYS